MAESPGWKEQLDRMQEELSALRQLDDGSFERWKNDAVKMLESGHIRLDRSRCSEHPHYFSRWIREFTGSHALKAPGSIVWQRPAVGVRFAPLAVGTRPSFVHFRYG